MRREGGSVGRRSNVLWVRVRVSLGLGDHERGGRDVLVLAGGAGVGGVGFDRFLSKAGETRRMGEGLFVDGSVRRAGGGGGVDSSVGEEGWVGLLSGVVVCEDVARRDGGGSVRFSLGEGG